MSHDNCTSIDQNCPLVTVGIPVYNGERVIRNAIDSVLRQTYCDYELVIVDDGSTDNTWEIIEKSYLDPRIIKYRGQENRGIAYRLNQLIERAHGRYFVRMDADDVMMPDRLIKQVAFLEQHGEVDVVGSSAIVMNEDYQILGIRGRAAQPSMINTGYWQASSFLHPTVMGRTEWFKKHQYCLDYKGYEDYELWQRTQKNSTFCNLYEPLLFYQDKEKYDLKTVWHNKWVGMRVYMREIRLNRRPWSALYQLLRSFVSVPVITVAHLLNLDAQLIRGRNRPLSAEDERRYAALLKEMISPSQQMK